VRGQSAESFGAIKSNRRRPFADPLLSATVSDAPAQDRPSICPGATVNGAPRVLDLGVEARNRLKHAAAAIGTIAGISI
jgi:hypothetical protein